MKDKIYLKDKERYFALPKKEIQYIIIINRKILIQCKDYSFYIRLPLSKIEEYLDNDFIRSHKSCIINISNIVYYDNKKRKAYFDDSNSIDLISEEMSKKIELYFKNKI